jgi:hypothetical protein
MRVKWTEAYLPSEWDLDAYPDTDYTKWDKEHRGEVIGATDSFWNGVQLTVMCDDGKVRTIESDKCSKDESST